MNVLEIIRDEKGTTRITLDGRDCGEFINQVTIRIDASSADLRMETEMGEVFEPIKTFAIRLVSSTLPL